jgi:hypothetical protein
MSSPSKKKEMKQVDTALSVLFVLAMGYLAVMILIAEWPAVALWLRAQHQEWVSLSRSTRWGVSILCLVVLGYFVAVTTAQEMSVRHALEKRGDTQAYWDGLRGGLSSEGAEAYSRYVKEIKEIDMRYHTLVANGDLDRLPPLRKMSPEEYLRRHPEFARTPEEEASWDPCFRAQVIGEPIPPDDEASR